MSKYSGNKYQPVVDKVTIFPAIVVGVQYYITVTGVKLSIVFFWYLNQVKVVYSKDL